MNSEKRFVRGTKVLALHLLSNSDHLLCPVRASLKMCTFLPAPGSAPVFFMLEGRSGHYTVITKSQFVLVFWSRLQRLGVSDCSKFRGHSFHRGGATWAFRSGVPDKLIQVYGDWASDAHKVYLEFSEDAKLRDVQRMICAFDEKLLFHLGVWQSRGSLVGRFSPFCFYLLLFHWINLSLCQTKKVVIFLCLSY